MKPSSLYIINKENSENRIQIGDFAPLIIMKDILIKTRVATGAFDYQAPEIIDAQSFDAKSDIWAIGAILLDMCTTCLYDVCIFFLI